TSTPSSSRSSAVAPRRERSPLPEGRPHSPGCRGAPALLAEGEAAEDADHALRAAHHDGLAESILERLASGTQDAEVGCDGDGRRKLEPTHDADGEHLGQDDADIRSQDRRDVVFERTIQAADVAEKTTYQKAATRADAEAHWPGQGLEAHHAAATDADASDVHLRGVLGHTREGWQAVETRIDVVDGELPVELDPDEGPHVAEAAFRAQAARRRSRAAGCVAQGALWRVEVGHGAAALGPGVA